MDAKFTSADLERVRTMLEMSFERPTQKLDLSDDELGIIERQKPLPMGFGFRCLDCAAACEVTAHTQYKWSRWHWVGDNANTYGWYITCPNCSASNFCPESLVNKWLPDSTNTGAVMGTKKLQEQNRDLRYALAEALTYAEEYMTEQGGFHASVCPLVRNDHDSDNNLPITDCTCGEGAMLAKWWQLTK